MFVIDSDKNESVSVIDGVCPRIGITTANYKLNDKSKQLESVSVIWGLLIPNKLKGACNATGPCGTGPEFKRGIYRNPH